MTVDGGSKLKVGGMEVVEGVKVEGAKVEEVEMVEGTKLEAAEVEGWGEWRCGVNLIGRIGHTDRPNFRILNLPDRPTQI